MNSHDTGDWENEGITKNKKTYFALLAHKNEEALASQIRNIRLFNPDAGIIVYNGGTDPNLGKKLNTLIYPHSHPIQYGNLTPYFWEIMKWLEQCGVEYEYLINLDHDVLFVKHGFQDYLHQLMKDYDVMGWDMITSSSISDAVLTCCRDMWKEWDQWGTLFRTNGFIRYLNSTQVYRHDIIRRMLETTDHQAVEQLIANSKVFALEEIFFVTLAASRGARIREYPREENWKRASRFRSQITLDEAVWVREHPYYYWIHPVKEAWLIRLNNWLMGGDAPIPDTEPRNVREGASDQPARELKIPAGEPADAVAAWPARPSKRIKRKRKKALRKSLRRLAGKTGTAKKRKPSKRYIAASSKRKRLKPTAINSRRKKKTPASGKSARPAAKKLKRGA